MRMPSQGRTPAGDPWRRSRVGELGEQLLPRWFVLATLGLVLAAAGAVVAAFTLFGPRPVPVAARRPPPAGGLTHAVGGYRVGASAPVVYDAACPLLAGVRIAGGDADQAVLRRGLAGLCNTDLDEPARQAVQAFARAGGVVRFAQFEATGVDSTADADAVPPRILVNARFARTDPLWVAPLVAHDATVLAAGEFTAEAALRARRVEAAVCRRLLAGRRPSRGCADAAALLELPEPLEALRAAGYR
jgi:hypothetical protein